MASFGEIMQTVGEGGKGAVFVMMWVLLAVVGVLIVVGGIWIWWYKKKKWNLDVEIKLTRAGANITIGEWGKGFYDDKKGVVFIKRPGMGMFKKPYPIKIFDVRRYMQGPNLITVIQVGPEDFRPVLNHSWSKMDVDYEDTDKPLKDEEGNPKLDDDGNVMYEITTVKESILNIKTETGLNKAWKAAWEEAAKNAYTIRSILMQYSAPISIGIVVICCFIGFAILWTKLSTVCG